MTNQHSEYEGGGVMPNSVFPKGQDALTAGDQLRLGYITGVEDDSKSRPDPYQFNGSNIFYPPTPLDVRNARQARLARQAQTARTEQQRYRQTPRPNGY